MRGFILISIFLLPGISYGGLLVNEPFTYPDGNLVGAAGSQWSAHSSAGSGPVTVASNQVKIILANSEDVSIGLPGSPYNTGNGVANLYASMKLNFTSLPSITGNSSGTGNYFAHFKDNGTANFRCRLYAQTTNAAAGFYRLAIASTNSVSTTAGLTQFPLNLATNTDYSIVLRLNLGTGNSTLWINPATETSTSVSSGADPGDTAGIMAFAFRQAASSSPGIAYVDNLKIGTTFGDVAGSNTAPTIGAIANQNTPAGTTLGPVLFDVSDAETPVSNLLVRAASSNTALVPNANIVTNGSSGTRSLTITPVAGQQGSATITVSVTDTDNNTSSTSFILTVGAPTISAIASQNIPQGNILPPIPFTIFDHEGDSLTVTGTSSNPNLIPVTPTNITLAGSGTNRTVTLTPLAGQCGITTITLSVSDGFNTNRTTFDLAVNPVLGVIFSDSFSYPDGPLLGATNSPWMHHIPTGTNNFGELAILSGVAQLNQTLNEDLNGALTNGPFAPSNAVILYASLSLKLTSLPGKGGEYFIHYKDGGSNFRGKIFVQTTNAAAGSYRISVANSDSSPTAEITQDLALNTIYAVVFRYNTYTATTTLWLNPTSESDSGATATDPTSPSTITAIALRQNSGIGVVQVDNLKVGTSFSEVTGQNPKLQTVRLSPNTFQISWPASAATFTLQSSATLSNWQSAGTPSLSNGQNVLVITNSLGRSFFRLKQ